MRAVDQTKQAAGTGHAVALPRGPSVRCQTHGHSRPGAACRARREPSIPARRRGRSGAAFSRAIWAEIAMSPPAGRGKERTSVGLSLRRKRRLSSRRRAVAGDQHVDFARNLCQLLRLPDEALDLRRAHAFDLGFKDDHQRFPKTKSGGPAPPSRMEFY